MENTGEQLYTDLMRQLAHPGSVEPAVLAETFREVERLHSIGQITDWQLENAQEAYARTSSVAGAGGRLGQAADRALSAAKRRLSAGAGQARDRAATAVATYTRQDPIKAILIAAGVGAVLMSMASMLAKSGTRTVRRRIRR